MSQTIFRSIEVDHGQHLTLGEPIPASVRPLLAPDGPGRWTLRPGTFFRAESITITVGANHLVQRMKFAYAAGTDYTEMLENFENEIGPPDSQEGTGDARRSTWEDSMTRFVLSERPDGTGDSVGSELTDRAKSEA